MSKLRRHITYANVVSSLALFVALGGASYAALKLPKDSVGAKHIRKGAVTTEHIAKGAVTAKKLRNGAIGSRKVRDGSLTEDDFAPESLPEGEPGEDGLDGLDGRDGEPGPEANPEWWVVVRADGTLVRGTATSSDVTKTGTGAYTVNFAADRTGCGFIASLDEGPGSVAAKSGPDESEDVLVTTFDAGGDAADRAFHLTARC